MPKVTATVNLTNGTVRPDPIPVNQGVDDGVKWQMPGNAKDYAFIYVSFDKYEDNFDNMSITENNAGRSILQIDDSVADLGDVKYTLFYIKKSEPTKVLSIDPFIRNQ